MKNNKKSIAIFLTFLLLLQCTNFSNVTKINNQNVYAFSDGRLQSNNQMLSVSSPVASDNSAVTATEGTATNQSQSNINSNTSNMDNNSQNIISNNKKTDRFIIKYKNKFGSDEVNTKIKKLIKKSKKLKSKHFSNGIDSITTNTKMTKDELLTELKNQGADSNIDYIEPDVAVNLASSDPYFSDQWGLQNLSSLQSSTSSESIDADVVPAWNESQGEGAVVAVIDTGIDVTHEDLKDSILTDPNDTSDNNVIGYNFVDNNNIVHSQETLDDEQHGTHVAGIIAAEKDNNIGIAGVAPKAKVMPLKVFSNGVANVSSIIEAIDYAENMGAKIANISWCSTDDSLALREAIQNSPILFVCAAGNNGTNNDIAPEYPAAYNFSNVISVASIDKNGELSSFSDYGANSVSVAAPGENIISTLPGNTYGQKSGTSMAAAFVTGEAALILSKYGNMSASQIKEKVMDYSDQLSSLAGKVVNGNKIDCARALGIQTNASGDTSVSTSTSSSISMPQSGSTSTSSSISATNSVPTAPGNLNVTTKTAISVSLSWTASTDTVPITEYDIYNEDTLVGTTTGGAIESTVSNLKENTAYNFTVKAKDAAGNVSQPSNAVEVTTDSTDPLGNSEFQLSDTSGNFQRNITDYFGKSGVYAPTGNYSRTFTDMSIPAPGFTLNFSRTYNSLNTNVGMFGKGWTFGFEGNMKGMQMTAKSDNNGDVISYYQNMVVNLPDGSTEVYYSTNYFYSYVGEFSRNTLTWNDNGTYTLTKKNHYTYTFNSSGYLTGMDDNNGNLIKILVDGSGKVDSVTDDVGRTFNINYNNQCLVSSLSDTESDTEKRTFTYSYDSNNNLTTVTDPMQHTITYGYDSSNMLTKICDKRNNPIELITYIHDGSANNNKVSQETDEYGNVHTYAYDNTNEKTTITDSNGRQMTQYYNYNFFITSTLDADGKTSKTTYNSYGEVTSETDRNGNTTTYTRDGNGNVTEISNPDGSYKTKTYDSNNNVTSEKDENGNYTYYYYDGNNNLITKAQPIDGIDPNTSSYDTTKFVVTNYNYSNNIGIRGLLGSESVSVSPTETDTTSYTYDKYGDVMTVTDPENKVTNNTYNTIGWKLSTASPDGFATTYSIDSDGNVEKQVVTNYNLGTKDLSNPTLPNGETTRVVYDNNGRKVKEIDPNEYNSSLDNMAQYSYNGDCGYRYSYYASGKIQTETDPENNTTTYTYDSYGNILTETKPSGAVYKYVYDVMNRPTKYYVQEDSNSPCILLEEYSYNIIPGTSGAPAQTQKTVTKHLNSTDTAVTVTNYDYAGRVISITNPDNTQSSTQYNANGTVASTKDNIGSVTYYKYDGLNRQTEKWVSVDTSGYTYSIKTYDNAGRVICEKTGKNKVALWSLPTNFITLNSSYYKNGKLYSTIDDEGREKVYTYDNDGNLTMEKDYTNPSNCIVTEYTYNVIGKPLTKSVHVSQGDISGNDISNTTDIMLTTIYKYDDNGNLIATTTPAPNNITTTYTYDKMNRQTSVSMPGIDENGNSVNITKSTTYNWDGKPLIVTDANGNTTTNAYSNTGLLLTVTDAKGGITEYQYDNAGRKIWEVSPANYISGTSLSAMNHIEYAYDLMDRLKTKTEVYVNKSGVVTNSIVTKAYQYDGNGNITKELDALGYEAGNSSTVDGNIANGYGITTTYNFQNKVSTVQDAESKARNLPYTTEDGYDALGRKISETNANGVITNYYYDDAGNVTKVTVNKATGAPEITQKTMTYDYLGNMLTSTDGNGNTTTYVYNAFGKVRTITYPLDGSIPVDTITYQYDVMGNVKQDIDSMSNEDVYTYDNQGRELSHTREKSDGSDAISTSTKYDKNGNKRFEYDGNNVKTEYTYDQLNRNVTTTIDNQTTTTGYDGDGNVISVEDWRGNTYSNTYDPFGKLIQKNDPDGNIIQKLTYYDNGLQAASYDALGVQYLNNGDATHCTKFDYDKNGRLLSTTDVLNHTTSQTYDNVGNIITKTDGDNNTTTYSYNEYNRLISVTNAKTENTSYTYDLNGNKLTQTDAKNNTISFEYNAANKVVRKIDAGGRSGSPGAYTYDPNKTESYSYNADGTLCQSIDRNGVATTYSYDSQGRKINQTTGDITISYTYDGNGNLLTETDPDGTTTRTYDNLNRTETKAVSDIGTSSYSYDIIPNIQGQNGYTADSTVDPAGNTATRTYDREGRLKTVQADGKTTTYNYDLNGNRLSVVYSDGSSENYTYYDDNQLKTLTNQKADGTVIDTYSYTYDADHNMISKTDSMGTTNYAYDSLNRLLTVSEPNGKYTAYSYDSAGNRQTETITQGTTTQVTSYSYNEQNRLLSTAVTVNNVTTDIKDYTNDNNGNVTAIVETPYVNGVAQPSESTVNIYDKLNQLTTTMTPDGTTECNIYNGDGYRVSKAVNGQITRYLYEGDKVILEEDGNGNQIAKNVYGTNLLSRTIGNDTLSYMYNGHGDVTALMNTTGSAIGLYYYDAFGNITESSGNVNNPYTYSGYQYDSETGLYYANSRMYDPKTARFMSEDTVDGDPNDPLSLNKYTYSFNNPLKYYDPTGHWPDWVDDIGSDISSGLDSISSDVSSAWNDTTSIASSAWNDTTSAVSSAWSDTTSAASSAWNDTTSAVSTAWDDTTSAASSAWNTTTSFIQDNQSTIDAVGIGALAVGSVALGVATLGTSLEAEAVVGGGLLAGEGLSASSIGGSALIGGGLNLGMSEFNNIESNNGTFNMSFNDGVAAYTGGFATGGLMGIGGGTSLLGTAALDGLSSGIGNGIQQEIGTGSIDYNQVLGATAFGSLTSVGMNGIVAPAINNVINSSIATPEFTMPEITTPQFTMPEITVPQITTPEVSPPQPLLPEFTTPTIAQSKIPEISTTGNVAFGACFVAGTKVITALGNRPIEEIKKGDKVLSRNVDTGEQGYKEVKNVFVKEVDTLVHLDIEGTKIDTTLNHRFWVIDQGWTEAGNLKEGDKVLLSSGKISIISKITIEKLSKIVKVYNFEVADWHTYFVSNIGVLVHNDCSASPIGIDNTADGTVTQGVGKPDFIVDTDGTVIPMENSYKSFNELKKDLGNAPTGYAKHHIVEQNPTNKSEFLPEMIQNKQNIIDIDNTPGEVHRQITGFMNSKPRYLNGEKVRDFVNQKSFGDQFNYGMNMLEKFGEVTWDAEEGWIFTPNK